MRKINGKLFLGLLIGGVVLTGCAVVVHYYQYQRIARALLWQARHAEEEGQVTRMARYLQRYLEFNPRDNVEKANLAKAWAGDAFASSPRSRRRAVRLLDDVLTWDDNPDPNLRRLLIKTALEVRDFKMAGDHLARLLPWNGTLETTIKEFRTAFTRHRGGKKEALPAKFTRVDAALGELEGYWGQVVEEDKRPAEALACYRLAVRHAPEMIANYARLAYLLRRTPESSPIERPKNLQEADETMNELVAKNATAAESYLARWRYRRDFDLMAIRETGNHGQIKLEKAAEDVADAVKYKRDSVEVLLAAADLERLLGRAAAENLGSTLAERRAGLRKHREKAFEYLRKGLDLVERKRSQAGESGAFQLLWHKGNLLMDGLEFQRVQAEEDDRECPDSKPIKEEIDAVIKLVRKSRMPAAADYMEGRLLAHEFRWAEAASRFERARTLMASQPDLACQSDLYLGQCYERLEEHTQMFKAFKRVIDWDPTSVPAMLGMAAARWAQGDLRQAEELYLEVMNQKRVPPRGWIDMARLEIQRQVQSAKPNWKQAELMLANARKFNPKTQIEIALLRSEVLVRQGKIADARELLAKERDAAPPRKAADLWTALADMELRENHLPEARRLLNAARTKVGDQVSLRLAEARYCLAAKDREARSKLVKLSENRGKFTENDQARLLSGLADAQLRAGNSSEAANLWQELAKLPRQKYDLRLRLLLFDLAMKDGNVDGMKKALDDIHAVEQTNGAFQHYGQALLLIWQAGKLSPDSAETTAKLQKAREELDRVLTLRPLWAPVFLARAEIAKLTGNRSQQLKNLLEAVNNGDRSPLVLARLMQLVSDGKHDREAKAIRDMVQKDPRFDPMMNMIMVDISLRAKDIDGALKFAQAAVREDTKDPQELLWRARVAMATNNTADVRKYLDKALKYAKDATPLVVKVQFLVEQKQRDEALKLIAEAGKTLPADQAPLALGLCHDAVRQTKEALASYEKALEAKHDLPTVKQVAAAHLNAGRRVEAEKLLREMVEKKLSGGSAEDVSWARRSLALLLAGGTDYKKFTEALGLVGLALDRNGRLAREGAPDESTENRRAKARVLASQQNQRQFRQKAIELLEELNKRNELAPDDRFVLALLLDAEGRTRDSVVQLNDLALAKTQTPQYLAQYAMSLIVHKSKKEDLAKAEQVINWLKDLEETRAVGPNGFASVELSARLHEARGEGPLAVKELEKLASRKEAKPEEVLLVLASMSRQKLYEQAFALCEKTWEEKKCMPEAVGGVSVALLRVMNPTKAQVKTVEKHLLTAVATKKAKQQPMSVLQMHLSDLYDKRGEYDKAEKLYRDILNREPNNVVALNNLAWLLATREGDAEKAMDYINRAVAGMGRRADLLDTRALVHMRLKNTAKALEDLIEATTEAPTPARLFHLAQAYHEDRNRAKAREALKRAQEKGLKVAQLHPIEQQTCKELLAEYELH